MCLQDVHINRNTIAHVLFDNGSKITLIRESFAQDNSLPFEAASYTLAGVGGQAVTYHAGKNGKIYSVPMITTNGDKMIVKAFAVDEILTEKVGREKVEFSHKDFPHISLSTLREAGKALPRKLLDLLIGNLNLLVNLLGWF